MKPIGIIGGSGLDRLGDLQAVARVRVETPYGAPSDELVNGTLEDQPVVFLARHGEAHDIAPHRVNYRANLWALQAQGVDTVISVCAVGGIRADIQPGALVVPDQVIDYTWSREHTLYNEANDGVEHIDFTSPYCDALRRALVDAAKSAAITIIDGATYAATQGPRLESAAEIDRLERDGSDIVGMTGMPETSIARELGLCYAALAVSANNAAGRNDGPIEMDDIVRNLESGMTAARTVLRHYLQRRSDAAGH